MLTTPFELKYESSGALPLAPEIKMTVVVPQSSLAQVSSLFLHTIYMAFVLAIIWINLHINWRHIGIDSCVLLLKNALGIHIFKLVKRQTP